jgi:hypothetical protein
MGGSLLCETPLPLRAPGVLNAHGAGVLFRNLTHRGCVSAAISHMKIP